MSAWRLPRCHYGAASARNLRDGKVKIAYVITRSDTVGGAHVHVLDLAVAAQREGHQVQVLVGGDGPYARMLREHGLQVVNLRHLVRPIRPHIDLLAVLECLRVFRRFRPDIVHAHSTKAGLVGRLAARLARIPAVFTAHGWAFTEGVAERSRRLAITLERRAAKWSKAVICVSEYDRRLALSLGVGNEALLVRIHNGVPDVPRLSRPNTVRNKVRLVSIARLDVPKDHVLLIEALATVRDIPWELELIGDGPLTETVRERVHVLGLADKVLFSGLCSDVPQRLETADIFALVSRWEGLPLSILEAMRAGVPVVASNVGGVSEAVQDEVTGYLVPKGDMPILADRLRRLMLDEQLRGRMGEAGRAVFEREFLFDIMYQRTTQVYRQALGHGGMS